MVKDRWTTLIETKEAFGRWGLQKRQNLVFGRNLDAILSCNVSFEGADVSPALSVNFDLGTLCV